MLGGLSTLAGNGTVEFTGRGSLSNSFNGGGGSYLFNESGHSLTGDVDNNISLGQFHNRGTILGNVGGSIIGIGSEASFVQERLIAAREGARVVLQIFRNWSNRGVLEATQESTLTALGPPVENLRDAQIVVESGSRLEISSLKNYRDGLVTGGGRIDLDDDPDDLFQNSGTLAPGDGVGRMVVDGHFEQTTFGTLAIELASTTPATGYDGLEVLGNAVLDGSLHVALVDDGNGPFVPVAGNTFEILYASEGITGQFATTSADLPPLPGNLTWQITYYVNLVVLSVVGGLPGDYNDDGTVNLADYTVWRDQLGAATGTLMNDNTGAAIGTAQYDLWKSNFGAVAEGLATLEATSVPEPGTWLLLLAACGLAPFGLRRNTVG